MSAARVRQVDADVHLDALPSLGQRLQQNLGARQPQPTPQPKPGTVTVLAVRWDEPVTKVRVRCLDVVGRPPAA